MRLLMVTPRYPPLSGGIENHVAQVALRLVKMGVEVRVLTTDPNGDLLPFELLEGVQVQRVRAWPKGRDYYFAPGIYREIRKGGWDLVHLQSYHTLVAPLAMLAALRAGIPYVVTFHGGGHSSALRNSARGAQMRLLRPLLAGASRLVATARFEIDTYSKKLGVPKERFVLIPNGADLTSTGEKPNGTVEAGLIASVGRLERYKGHHRILAAMPEILRKRPDARLWIAGTGPYQKELASLAGRIGVEDRVEIRAIPPGEREQMARELSKADLVVLLSEFETHPMAVLEAVALGKSVLVADTSGLSEMAEQNLAVAIPLQSTSEQIADAVVAQLESPNQPGQLNISTWDECSSSLLDLYQEVLGKGAGR